MEIKTKQQVHSADCTPPLPFPWCPTPSPLYTPISLFSAAHSLLTSVMLKLVLCSSMDAVLEATRVYGNLSQSKDVREFIMQNRGIWQTPSDTHNTLQHETTIVSSLVSAIKYSWTLSGKLAKSCHFRINNDLGLTIHIYFKKANVKMCIHLIIQAQNYTGYWVPWQRMPSTVLISAYCVMFRLDLSARLQSVKTRLLTGDSCPLIFALLRLLPHNIIFLHSLSLSAPVCCDTARLKKHWDVYFSLRGPHQPGSGPPQQG